ncbi:MAG: FAD-dependent oxidoreductase, partial [Sphingomonadales bacterium]
AGIKQVLNYGGYLTPAIADMANGENDGRVHVLGATFADANPDHPGSDPGTGWRAVTSGRHRENLDRLMIAQPSLDLPPIGLWKGRTGLRATTPDQLPVAGGIIDRRAFIAAFAALSTGARMPEPPPVPYLDGLYVLTGLGSRGFTTAPLLAETLAALITGTPCPLPRPLCHAVHPARFLVRALKRGISL